MEDQIPGTVGVPQRHRSNRIRTWGYDLANGVGILSVASFLSLKLFAKEEIPRRIRKDLVGG